MKFLDDGLDDSFDGISGVNDALLKDVNIKYDGGASPQFSVDRLATTNSDELYRSDDGYGRMFVYHPEASYKVIASSMVFGALRDGDSLSKKPYLMAEMVDYFLGITTITDIREAFGSATQDDAMAYPNPASAFTTFSIALNEANANLSLHVFDDMGRMVRVFEKSNLSSGKQEIIWDLKDASGANLTDGLYFYQINVNKQMQSSGKILIKR